MDRTRHRDFGVGRCSSEAPDEGQKSCARWRFRYAAQVNPSAYLLKINLSRFDPYMLIRLCGALVDGLEDERLVFDHFCSQPQDGAVHGKL